VLKGINEKLADAVKVLLIVVVVGGGEGGAFEGWQEEYCNIP
jgi:hypothetical protein